MIISNENISVAEVRRLLRDPANREDDLLIGTALAKNALNFRFMQSTPTACKRIVPAAPAGKYGTARFGNTNVPKLRYRDNFQYNKIIPEYQYNPVVMSEIRNGTKLGEGLPLSLFTGKYLKSKTSLKDRKGVAKHFYLQTLLMNGVRNNSGRFSKAGLNVVEGLFAPETGYTITSGNILELQTEGRAVVYNVTNLSGANDPAAAFNIAQYWKDAMLFDELILSYDTVDPSLDYTAHIIVIMPSVDDKYNGNFRRIVKTQYNYNTALENGLAELVV